ncbi:hypothetical protein ACE1CI_01420 [Aerosakkonemataceae cyanobacterium BLCC-F50]|uniref:Uncharacterized protein n=1 Tax=Floridaenema flaviceps BLCC-F50 TaxID=3153642 RepID=A0ABV4XIP5_9CYAN
MSNSKWAAMVYGRTYEVDFRFIATPKDFKYDENEKNWALNHILTTTRSASKLSGNARWSLFKNECHCVIGVTCMVRELIGRTTETSEDLTKDSKGRPLYIFVGYVSKVDKEHGFPLVPPYSGNNLEIFEPLYQHVRDVWFVKNYEEASKIPSLTDYQDLPEYEFSSSADYDLDFAQSLNYQNPDKVFLWSDSEEYRQKLWMAAPKCKKPISICLGLAGQKDIIYSSFLNGTADDVVQPIEINKHCKQADQWDGVDDALSPETSRRVPAQQQPSQSVGSRQETVKQQHQYHQIPETETDNRSLAEQIIDTVGFAAGKVINRGRQDIERVGELLNQDVRDVFAPTHKINDDNVGQQRQHPQKGNISQPQQERRRRSTNRYRRNSTSQQREIEDFGFKPMPETNSQKSQQNDTQQSDSPQNSDSQDWF